MKLLNTLVKRYLEANSQYETIKTTCENQIVRWEYASGPYYQANPFTNQIWQIPSGKLLKEDITNQYYLYKYGFNSSNKIVVKNEIEDNILKNEEFILYEGDVVNGWSYNHSGKEIINVTSAKYLNDKILELTCFTKYRWSKENFKYEDDLIIQIEDTSYFEDKIDRISYFNISYFENKKLKSIEFYIPAEYNEGQPHRRMIYQRPEKGQSIKEITKNVEDKLIKAIYKTIAEQKITEKIYCIILSYSFEQTDFFPPFVSIGFENERIGFIESEAKEAKRFIWNPSELKNHISLIDELDDKDLMKECNILNNYIVQNEKDSLIAKIYNNILEGLLKYDWKTIAPVTSDFVIFINDGTDRNYLRSLKKYNNAESLKELKGKKLI